MKQILRHHATSQSRRLLSTGVFYLLDYNDVKKCGVLLDNAAANSFLNNRSCKNFELKLGPIEFSICRVGQITNKENLQQKLICIRVEIFQ